MIEVVGAIVEARPDHVIWGSNRAHAGIAVPSAVPQETLRKQILSENPGRLYGWPTSQGKF